MKMKPRRLIALIVWAILLVFLCYRAWQGVQADPNSIFVYLYGFVVIGLVVSATRIPTSRRYILDHPRTVKAVGIFLGGVGVVLIIAFIVVAARSEPSVPSELYVWAALAPIVLGFMIYRLSEIATPKKEIIDFFEWLNK